VVAVDGRPALGRSHPLTVEGDDVGAFELNFACGEQGRDYIVTYVEQRRGNEAGRVPAALSEVEISLAGKPTQLKVVASRPRDKSTDLVSIASGRISVEALKAFADTGNRSLMVETASDDAVTAIRIGNAGIGRILPTLAASCAGASQPTIRNSARFSRQQGG
jgi:predicted PhzF superfamily epimerase YddE/YHI9